MSLLRAPLFGVDVESELALPGVEAAPLAGTVPLRIAGARRAGVVADFASAETLAERRDERGAVTLRIARDPDAGWLLQHGGWGAYALDPGATLLRCAPARMAAWRWQRYLIAQVLPWAAVVRGFEVLHASAIEHEGRAIAITGPSGAGKSTVAAALLARGCRLVADDVLALDGTTAHSGPGILSVRPGTAALVPDVPGRPIGTDEHGLRLAVARAPAVLPLGALVFLERSDEAGGVVVERLTQPDPRRLLASTFNLALRTPDRLARLLDTCAAIAAGVPVLEARAGTDAGPHELARSITDLV